MKKTLSKISSFLPGFLVAVLVLVNTNIVSATIYPYDYPYVVTGTTPPPPSITVSLAATVNPVNYPAQTSTTLLWNTTGSPDTCTGTDGFGSWPGAKDPTSPAVHQEVQSGLVPGIYTYKIICVKGPDVANASVMVVVDDNTPNPTTVTLIANPNPINSGSSSNLSWTSTNATTCQTGAGPWQNPGNKPLNSSAPESTGSLTVNTTYEIICTGSNNIPVSALATVYINTPPAPTIRFTATPNVINAGNSSMLSWSTTNATSCYANGGPWSGTKSVPTGTESTGPLSTTTSYVITCDGPNGSATANAVVYVNPIDDPLPPTISYFQPYSCVSGGSRFGSSPKFAWESQHTTSCTITRVTAPSASQTVGVSAQASGGSLEFDGLYYYLTNLPVVGSSSSYRLQCVNGPQTVTEYAAVNVCSPDFSLAASPILRSFVNGVSPKTGLPGKVATYTISVNPISGFANPVTLSIQSNPTMPPSTEFYFSPDIVSRGSNGYDTSTLTIWIDSTEFPAAGNTTYSPIIVQGVGGSFTRTVTIGADATGKKIMKYREPDN